MNLKQLRLLAQAAECDLNISRTARRAHTSQPSVSRHLQALEAQLGVRIFIRRKRKVMGLTDTGRRVLQSARRVLHEIEAMNELSAKAATDHGSITVAASHTYARYSLPAVVRTFMQRYPNVRFVLRQGDPQQIVTWAATGAVDVAICAEPEDPPRDLAFFSCGGHERLILTPTGHPLGRLKKPTLRQISGYPLITYDSQFAIHRTILGAFEAAGLTPNIVLTATDVDVMKTYVKCGLGIAVVPSLAYTRTEDRGLVAINANHLFEPTTMRVALRRDTYLRPFVYDFIELFAPGLRRSQIQSALMAG